MRPSRAVPGLACLLLLLLAAPTASADVIDCTVTLAGDQYFDTGDYLFGHGQLKEYAGDTVDNTVLYFYCAGFT